MAEPRRMSEVRAAAADMITAGFGTGPPYRTKWCSVNQHHRRVGDESTVTQEMVLVEHETFPAQLFRQLDLLQNLLIVDVVGRVAIRKVGRQYVHIEAHRFLLLFSLRPACPRSRNAFGSESSRTEMT